MFYLISFIGFSLIYLEFDASQLGKLWTATEQAAGGRIMVGL